MEHLCRRAAVNIVVVEERLNHVRIVGDVRQHTQFNLRIVRVDQHPAGTREEEAAQLAPQLRAHRDILQIRLRGADAARTGFRLVKAGMNPAVRANHFQKAIAVGGFQLGQGAVIEHLLHRRMLIAQAFQHLRVGGVARFCLFPMGKAQLHKESVTQLLGGIDVELITDGLVNLLLQALNFALELLAISADSLAVHREALHFHMGQHAGQRDLDLIEKLFLPLFPDLRAQLFTQTRQGGARRDLSGLLLRRALHLRHRHGVLLHKPGNLIPLCGGIQQIGSQRYVKYRAGQACALPFQSGIQLLGGRNQLAGLFIGADLLLLLPAAEREHLSTLSRRHSHKRAVFPISGTERDLLLCVLSIFRRGFAPAPRDRRRLPGPRRGRLAGRNPHFLHQGEKLQPRHERSGGRIHRAGDVVGKRCIHRRIGADGAKPAAEVRVILGSFQLFALALLDIELRKMIINIVKIMEALNQLARSLRADSGHTGDVVRGIALDRLDVDELSRFDSVSLADLRFVIDRCLRLSHLGGGKAHSDAAAHQLETVAVTGGDHTLRALLPADTGKGAENVVRFKAVALDEPVAKKLQKLFEVRELLGQFLRHAFALRLIARVRLVAECWGFPVKRNGHGVRLRLRQQPLQHGQESIDPVCIQALLGGKDADPVKSPVQDAVAIQN